MARGKRLSMAGPITALAVLLLGAAETLSRPRAEDAEAYHGRVSAAHEVLSERVRVEGLFDETGERWAASDRVVPPSALALLKPNVIYSRMFARGQEHADVLIVQCKDARDIYGHYPPNCYRGSGYTIGQTEDFDWVIGGVEVRGRRYDFLRSEGSGIVVYNFIPMPGGRIMRDMTQVRRNAWDYTKKFHGGSQVQVVFDAADTTQERREEVARFLIGAHLPLIREIIGEIQ